MGGYVKLWSNIQRKIHGKWGLFFRQLVDPHTVSYRPHFRKKTLHLPLCPFHGRDLTPAHVENGTTWYLEHFFPNLFFELFCGIEVLNGNIVFFLKCCKFINAEAFS